MGTAITTNFLAVSKSHLIVHVSLKSLHAIVKKGFFGAVPLSDKHVCATEQSIENEYKTFFFVGPLGSLIILIAVKLCRPICTDVIKQWARANRVKLNLSKRLFNIIISNLLCGGKSDGNRTFLH